MSFSLLLMFRIKVKAACMYHSLPSDGMCGFRKSSMFLNISGINYLSLGSYTCLLIDFNQIYHPTHLQVAFPLHQNKKCNRPSHSYSTFVLFFFFNHSLLTLAKISAISSSFSQHMVTCGTAKILYIWTAIL